MPTVLVVDDDAGFVAALGRVFLQIGYRIRLAQDGRTAFEAATQPDDTVDLVVADLHLFQESGLDLLSELRRKRPELPMILLSAAGDPSSYLEALRLGAYEYLSKPPNFAELRSVAERALSPVRRTS